MLILYNCLQSEVKENKIMDLEKKIKESDDKIKKNERLMTAKKEKITKLTKEVTYTKTIKINITNVFSVIEAQSLVGF